MIAMIVISLVLILAYKFAIVTPFEERKQIIMQVCEDNDMDFFGDNRENWFRCLDKKNSTAWDVYAVDYKTKEIEKIR